MIWIYALCITFAVTCAGLLFIFDILTLDLKIVTLYPEATAEYKSIAIGCRIGHSNCKSSRPGISTQQKFNVLLKQQTDFSRKIRQHLPPVSRLKKY